MQVSLLARIFQTEYIIRVKSLHRGWGNVTRPLIFEIRLFCSIYGRRLSQKIFFSKPIRRLEPIERPAEEASLCVCV
jgi:uncharacterized PurR-regulated membrane protein YhhQ (DUF165 family)